MLSINNITLKNTKRFFPFYVSLCTKCKLQTKLFVTAKLNDIACRNNIKYLLQRLSYTEKKAREREIEKAFGLFYKQYINC